MLKVGDTVTFYDPGSVREHESWQRGTIRKTLVQAGATAIHIVTINAHKWDLEAPWGLYDGVPELLGRETDGNPDLEFLDTWPRRLGVEIPEFQHLLPERCYAR
jgi:hypothetical protein